MATPDHFGHLHLLSNFLTFDFSKKKKKKRGGRGAYILISAAGTSSGGLSTDEEDLTKQGEHTETFFIYIFHSFK